MSLLVLARNVGEKIIIGDDITITITAINGKQVKVGIDAPRHLRVDREEIRARINAQAIAKTTSTEGGAP
mgnify:CR=1 FL=1